jgi:nucleoside-diphosphate-sugar epimerase
LDRHAIEALGSALEGSDRPLVVTSGTGLIAPGRHATEDDVPDPASTSIPRVSEQTAAALAARGIRTSVVRLSQVHDFFRQGLVSYAIAVARGKGVSAFVGDGLNRWPAVPLADAARLYRLVLEKTATEKHAEGSRYHAVAEEGVALRETASLGSLWARTVRLRAR